MKTIDNAGHLFACGNATEEYRAKTLFTKEEGTIRWLQSELKPGDVFYDIGANIGCYTIVAAKLVGETGMVYAFEPHVGNAASLLRNVALNKLKNVRLLTVALGDREDDCELLEFNYAGLMAGSSGSQLGHTLSENGKEFNPEAVQLKTARSLNNIKRLRPASLVKIDVDGNERGILRGGDCFLNHPTIRSLQVELHPSDAGEIIAMMNRHGFSLVERHYTANGKKQLEKGADPLFVVHNAIFRRSK